MIEYTIYISDLAKYSEGRLVGEWVTLPQENILEIKNKIVKNNHEHFITDYDLPFDISEYEDLEELNEFITKLKELNLDSNTIQVLAKVCDSGDFRKKILDEDFIIIDATKDNSICDKWEMAYTLYEEGHQLENIGTIPEGLKDYMDWDHIWNEFNISQGWQGVTVHKDGELNQYIVRA